MARKYLDTTGLTALWAKIINKINALGNSLASVAFSGSYNDLINKPTVAEIDDSSTANNKAWSASKIGTDLGGKVSKTGDSMTGSLDLLGSELHLKTTSSSSNDSGDIVWFYGNGQEKARIWTADSPTTINDGRLNFRCYKSDGTALSSGKLATASDVDGKVSKSGDTMTGNLKFEGSSQPSIIFKESGYGDKFELKTSFSGTDEQNYLAIKTATGAAGTDPSTSDKIRIRPSGKLEFVNTSRNIEVPARATSYVDGAKGNAGIYMPHAYNADQWGPILCVQNKAGGSWSVGSYNGEDLEFVNFTKANIDSNTNTARCNWKLSPTNGFVGPWNGITDDHGTNNTTDTWVPVYTGSKIQHRVIPTTIAGTTEQSYTRNHASVSYTENLRCWRFGNVITLGGYFSCSGNIAANTLLYTLPSPKFVIYFTAKHETQNRMYNFNLQTNGQLKTNEAIAGGNYLVCFTYVCA